MKKLLMPIFALVVGGCAPAPAPVSQAAGADKPRFGGAVIDKAMQEKLRGPKAQSVSGTNEKGEAVSVRVEDGRNLAQYGLPIYPGAKLDPDARGVYRKDTAAGIDTIMTLLSKDGVKPIAQFYREKIPNAKVEGDAQGAVITGTVSDGQRVIVMIAAAPKSQTIININATKKR